MMSMRNMQNVVRLLILTAMLLAVASCRTWQEPAGSSDACPDIFPDYSEVTIPSNIAPMNFMVEDAMNIQASFMVDGKRFVDAVGRDGVISISERSGRHCWRRQKVHLWKWRFQYGTKHALMVCDTSLSVYMCLRMR